MQAEATFPQATEAAWSYAVLARVSPSCSPLLGRLSTCYSPVRRSIVTEVTLALDLHVLSTPPAFILSQDQTLQFKPSQSTTRRRVDQNSLFAFCFPRAELALVALELTLSNSLFSFQRTGVPLGTIPNSASGQRSCQPPFSFPSSRARESEAGDRFVSKNQPRTRQVVNTTATLSACQALTGTLSSPAGAGHRKGWVSLSRSPAGRPARRSSGEEAEYR